MHSFSNLFDIVLHVLDRSTVHHQQYLSSVGCLLAWWTTPADSQHNQHDKYLFHVYSVEVLLMMDSGSVQNM